MNVDKVFHMNGGLGDNSYAQNSSVQKRASDTANYTIVKSLVETYTSLTPKSLGIADLGCSSGQNTFSTVRQMVEAIDKTAHKLFNIPPPEYRVYLNDLPSNDFNSIFKTLPDFYRELNNERRHHGHEFDSNVFVAAYPATFYGRLFPDKYLHFIYSSSSLHWLSRVPPGLYDKQGKSINKGCIYISKTSPAQVSKAYFDQFHQDFTLFLQARSNEVQDGGQMVLMLSGRRDDQNHVDRGNSFFWELLSRSFKTLVSQGKVMQEKVDEYDTHFYAPSRNELEKEIEEEGSFKIECFEMFEIVLRSGGTSMNTGTTLARTTRAVQESMISSHFGEEILDDLFEIYGGLIDEEMAKEDISPVGYIIVLKKT